MEKEKVKSIMEKKKAEAEKDKYRGDVRTHMVKIEETHKKSILSKLKETDKHVHEVKRKQERDQLLKRERELLKRREREDNVR